MSKQPTAKQDTDEFITRVRQSNISLVPLQIILAKIAAS